MFQICFLGLAEWLKLGTAPALHAQKKLFLRIEGLWCGYMCVSLEESEWLFPGKIHRTSNGQTRDKINSP
jgi:hypothetical protein